MAVVWLFLVLVYKCGLIRGQDRWIWLLLTRITTVMSAVTIAVEAVCICSCISHNSPKLFLFQILFDMDGYVCIIFLIPCIDEIYLGLWSILRMVFYKDGKLLPPIMILKRIQTNLPMQPLVADFMTRWESTVALPMKAISRSVWPVNT